VIGPWQLLLAFLRSDFGTFVPEKAAATMHSIREGAKVVSPQLRTSVPHRNLVSATRGVEQAVSFASTVALAPLRERHEGEVAALVASAVNSLRRVIGGGAGGRSDGNGGMEGGAGAGTGGAAAAAIAACMSLAEK